MATALINLLPDVHQDKLRAQHQRQLLITGTVLVVAVALVSVIGLFVFTLAQGIRLHSLQNQITQRENQQKQFPDLENLVTTQQNLAALPKLYQGRVYITDFFAALSAASPTAIAISSAGLNSNNLSVSATARGYSNAAKFVKALQLAKLSSGTLEFPTVTMGSASLNGDSTVTFNVMATVDPGVTSGSK